MTQYTTNETYSKRCTKPVLYKRLHSFVLIKAVQLSKQTEEIIFSQSHIYTQNHRKKELSFSRIRLALLANPKNIALSKTKDTHLPKMLSGGIRLG